MAKAQNRIAKTELLSAQAILANKQATALLNLPPFSDVYQLNRVRYLEERPVVYVTNYVRPELFNNLLDYDLTHSLTDIYREHFAVTYHKTRYRIAATILLGEVAQALRATVGTPAMLVERTNYAENGELIDCAIEYWRHDAISIGSVAELV